MTQLTKKFSTLFPFCLHTILLLSVVMCASAPERSPHLKQDLYLKSSELKKEIQKPRVITGKTVATLAKRPEPSPSRSFHPAPRPVKKIHLPEDDIESKRLDVLVGDEEESISDSSQEILHFYYVGYQLLSEGKFDNAIRSFEHFLEENPTHLYADRAQYLITEANCRAKENHLCLLSANTLLTRYPYSLKIPETLVWKIQALRSLGQSREAEDTMASLEKKYPDHPVVHNVKENRRFKNTPRLLLEEDNE